MLVVVEVGNCLEMGNLVSSCYTPTMLRPCLHSQDATLIHRHATLPKLFMNRKNPVIIFGSLYLKSYKLSYIPINNQLLYNHTSKQFKLPNLLLASFHTRSTTLLSNQSSLFPSTFLIFPFPQSPPSHPQHPLQPPPLCFNPSSPQTFP